MISRLPPDWSRRIKNVREVRGLTQIRFAELVGVSFVTVNRWENHQSRPNNIAWQRILEIEADLHSGECQAARSAAPLDLDSGSRPGLDFAADPNAVAAVIQAHYLAFGHLVNPRFATEISRIDPLPHQRIAVYERMLPQSPLRFLLADDAGAGKTIMTGLYLREMLTRKRVQRVLIVPPAGLVGNWERELRILFGLRFQIASGTDARVGNPFLGSESDKVIVSIDTLAGERTWRRLQEASVHAYDLVVFDEAHKLSAQQGTDGRTRKTDRYKLAESLAGIKSREQRWRLSWSARHLLLLTATPHMGKDFPYFALWRLLLPDALPTFESFLQFPVENRWKHFVRRAKEEMVRFDSTRLFPQRCCATLSYDLMQGEASEQELYDETTDYIRENYNRAAGLNRTAARLAMSVFQRRLASSVYAVMRSFERRKGKLEGLVKDIEQGRLTEAGLVQQQQTSPGLRDLFETSTAEEDVGPEGGSERHETYEDEALAGTAAASLPDLQLEIQQVEALRDKAQRLLREGEDSKFEKLREVLQDPTYADEKFIIFTEHRDTAHFLIRRFESLGYTGQIAFIHGGLPYPEREKQVAFFRKPVKEDGALYLVATDAAGEGINLQFCWLMVNYDIPWNPARLEQRMGRIHRYGQAHDPVIIVNLVAGQTREGQVLKTLLEKLESIRIQLQSDKVFDVIGRLFENLSIKDYLEQALVDDASAAASRLNDCLSMERVRKIEASAQALFGLGGEVARKLTPLKEEIRQEELRQLLPGHVCRFMEVVAPLLHLRMEGDRNGIFTLQPLKPQAMDFLLSALEMYPAPVRTQLTAFRPQAAEDAIWIHPGEPVFDCISATIREQYGLHALKGAVFIDPAAQEPYLYHVALASVVGEAAQDDAEEAHGMDATANHDDVGASALDSRLVGLRQVQDGPPEEWPVEHMFLLKGAADFAPSREPLAVRARGSLSEAAEFVQNGVAAQLAQRLRRQMRNDLARRLEVINRGFDFQVAELAAARARAHREARAGDAQAVQELREIKVQQKGLQVSRRHRLEELRTAPDGIRAGPAIFLAHTLVVPMQNPEEAAQYDAQVESVAMEIAIAYEKGTGAEVKDVSRPELARRAGLPDWPGFDFLSFRANGERRAIEVKGRADTGSVSLSENEWIRAYNLRGQYWLYVVFGCATLRPHLARVGDPFAMLLAEMQERKAFVITSRSVLRSAEADGESEAR